MAALRKHTLAPISDAAPFVVRSERASDIAAREALASACATDKRPPKALRFRR